MWQFSRREFENEEIIKDFLDDTMQLWRMNFDIKNSYGVSRSFFNCALRYKRHRINSETNKSHGKSDAKKIRRE